MTVARLARGFTKRKFIVKFSGNYHGHADFFLVQAGSGFWKYLLQLLQKVFQKISSNTRLVCLTMILKLVGNFFQILIIAHRIAAVILEPITGNMGVIPADLAFIQFLRKETEKMGALLIFDEVITGFRVDAKGAQKFIL